VARNVLRDTVKAQVRRESFAAELGQHWQRSLDADVADDVAERLAVLRAMAELPEDDREILILVAWQGLTPRDAAKVLGCSAAALRVRLHRARKRLTAALDLDLDAEAFEPAGPPAFQPVPTKGRDL
jgi:RNA polymerase sigma-70 factor (ECF subfamily)